MGLALENGIALENGAKGLINRLARQVEAGTITVEQAAELFANRGKVPVAQRPKFAQRVAVQMGQSTAGTRGKKRTPQEASGGRAGKAYGAALDRLDAAGASKRAARQAALAPFRKYGAGFASQSDPGIQLMYTGDEDTFAASNPGIFGGIALENPFALGRNRGANYNAEVAGRRNRRSNSRRAIVARVKAMGYKIDGSILKSPAQRRTKNHLHPATTLDGKPLYIPGTKIQYMTSNAAAIQRDLAKRVGIRAKYKKLHLAPDDALLAVYGPDSTLTGIRAWQGKKGIKPGTSVGRKRRGGRFAKGSPEAKAYMAELRGRKGKAKPNGMFGGLALENGIALENVGLSDFASSAKYAAIAGVVGAGSGVVHYKLVPLATEMLYSKLPGAVGEYAVEYNYAITGILGGVAVGAAALALPSNLRGYALAGATGVAMAGGLLQVFKYLGLINEEGSGSVDEVIEEVAPVLAPVSSEFGPVAASDAASAGEAPQLSGIFGGVAHHNPGVFGDGMAYQLASVAGGLTGQNFGDANFDEGVSTYSGASLADALHSGADLDVEEGEAACMGQHTYLDKFGYPTVRISQMGGHRGPSHLAGRRGHRWGWLIKMVGFRQFQALAQLPPERRLLVLSQMRASAIQQFQDSMKRVTMSESPKAVSGSTATVPEAPMGADSNYGATLFASPEYLG